MTSNEIPSVDSAATLVPTGDELFLGPQAWVVERPEDRYGRKPNGSSDQGYKED